MGTCIPREAFASVRSKFRELLDELEKERGEIGRARKDLNDFLQRFPFRSNPERIDDLRPEDLYSPGRGDYFFYYVEFRLRPLGRIGLGSAMPWKEAARNIDVFKSLLKKIVDDSIPLHEKIDSEECERLRGWGGDRTIVKKIVSLYYLDDIVPIFLTGMLETIVSSLNLWECVKEVAKRFGKPYSRLSTGEKFEVLNEVLLSLKRSVDELKGLDNAIYGYFLSIAYCRRRPRPLEVEHAPANIPPLVFEPANEFEVIALFCRYHLDLGFPYILKLNPQGFPDATVIDMDRNTRTIEFELRSSNFVEHRHDPDKVDYIVCWVDDLPEGNELKKKVIELKSRLKKAGASPS